MDALKILCRSTTISRKSSNKPIQISRPSTGEAKNPRFFGREEEQDISHESQESRKRKREENISAEQDAELDFFGDRKRKTKTAMKDGEENRVAQVQDDKSSGDERAVEEDIKELPEAECRRILKTHKLKITRIWPEEEEPPDKKKRKRDKKKTEQDTKADAKHKKRKLDVVPQPLTSFAHLRSRSRIDKELARNIDEQGYKLPTEVQLGALPLLLDGGNYSNQSSAAKTEERSHGRHASQGPSIDLLTVAPTGSGKTLAFLIPVINAISQQKSSPSTAKLWSGPSAVIVAPTKELAAQITNEARKLTQNMAVTVSRVRKGMKLQTSNDVHNHGSDLVHGIDSASGDSSDDNHEERAAKERSHQSATDIIVTTPLALVKAITGDGNEGHNLDTIRYLVLDEADVLLDQMFRTQTLKIWKACTSPQLRVSLWSATMGSNIEDLAMTTIVDHRKMTSAATPRAQILRLVVGLKDSAIPSIEHKLIYAANEAGKLLAMRQLLRPSRATSTTVPAIQPPFLVFTQTIPRAIALASELRYDIPPPATTSTGGSRNSKKPASAPDRLAVLHADLSDAARAAVMARFRAGDIWVLITTDLLSRGVDFRGVNAVVNYDVPSSSAAYVHRVGRTGRAGREGGVAVTLYAEEDIPVLRNVVNVIRAAEKAGAPPSSAASTSSVGGAQGQSVGQITDDWLANALPKLGKHEKQLLKKRGVEARRPRPDAKYNVGGKPLPSKARTRISTKSGYERRLEDRRRAATAAAKGRAAAGDNGDED